jgi:hypothetical protein
MWNKKEENASSLDQTRNIANSAKCWKKLSKKVRLKIFIFIQI